MKNKTANHAKSESHSPLTVIFFESISVNIGDYIPEYRRLRHGVPETTSRSTGDDVPEYRRLRHGVSETTSRSIGDYIPEYRRLRPGVSETTSRSIVDVWSQIIATLSDQYFDFNQMIFWCININTCTNRMNKNISND